MLLLTANKIIVFLGMNGSSSSSLMVMSHESGFDMYEPSCLSVSHDYLHGLIQND